MTIEDTNATAPQAPSAELPANPDPGSRPFIMRPVTLKSFHAQQFYEIEFSPTAASLLTLMVLTRARDRHDLADEAERLVRQLFTEFRERIQAEIEHADRLIATHGLGDLRVEYTRPQTFSVKLTSPYANQYLGLIMLLDELFYRLDVLHITGLIDTRSKLQRTFAWKRKLRLIARQVSTQTSRTNRTLRQQAALMAHTLSTTDEVTGEPDTDDATSKSVGDLAPRPPTRELG